MHYLKQDQFRFFNLNGILGVLLIIFTRCASAGQQTEAVSLLTIGDTMDSSVIQATGADVAVV